MEEVLPRPRYSRSSSTYRKKKRNAHEGDTFKEKVIMQTILCIFILIVVGTVKYINTPFTNFASDKVKTMLFQNIELKSVYATIEDFFNNILKRNAIKSNDSVSDGNVIPADTGVSTPANTNSDITDAGKETVKPQDTSEIVKAINLKYKFVTPVNGVISSPFGERMHPLLKKLMLHNGVDIEANKGDEIKAALEGTIAETGNDVTYGYYIKIKSGNGLQTVYAHCSKILFKKGDVIKQGQVIGNVGDTGLTVGAHLHFEIWINQKAYDPMNFIKV